MNSIGHDLSTVCGLGATMVGASTAVGKGIAKSGLPPVQKAGVIIGGAIIRGFSHSVISTMNINAIYKENTPSFNNTNLLSNDISSKISKFMDDSSWSPLQTLLFDIQGINATCLNLIIILIIQIIFKLYLSNSIKLNLSNILGINFNNNLEYYINKIITLNKKMSNIYIYH